MLLTFYGHLVTPAPFEVARDRVQAEDGLPRGISANYATLVLLQVGVIHDPPTCLDENRPTFWFDEDSAQKFTCQHDVSAQTIHSERCNKDRSIRKVDATGLRTVLTAHKAYSDSLRAASLNERRA